MNWNIASCRVLEKSDFILEDNHTDNSCTFLDIGTTVGIDICEYPDSNKINILPYEEIYQKDNALITI